MRSVIRCSGCDSKALWTVKPGRYVVIGTSRSSSPDWTACITAVAVKTFDIDWTLKIVSTVTGVPPVAVRGAEPLLPHHLVAVDQGQGQAGDVLLGHQLGDPGPVARDDRGDAVALGGRRRDGGRTARCVVEEHPDRGGNRRTGRLCAWPWPPPDQLGSPTEGDDPTPRGAR